MKSCSCGRRHDGRRIVLTGGPGAGKTAILELIHHSVCAHVTILPESAGILFGGGFPRGRDVERRRSAQRAIFHVQRELEAIGDTAHAALVLCDRGTVDGAAFWPGADPAEFWSSIGTSLENEQARYAAVIHLRTPPLGSGLYNHSNPLRLESEAEAAAIDQRIGRLWATHPRHFEVPASADFLKKAAQALEILKAEMPACCRDRVTALTGYDPVTPGSAFNAGEPAA